MFNPIESEKSGLKISFRPGALLLLASMLLLQACGYKGNHILFQAEKKLLKHGYTVIHIPGDTNRAKVSGHYEHHVRVGDRLAVKFLNNYDISTGITFAGGSTDEVTFLVDANGEIILPMVGRLKVEGMTRKEVGLLLEEEFKAFFERPRIEVQVVGMKISILGEVSSPGVYGIEDEEVNLVNAIARAGGLTASGKAKSVRLVRNFPGKDSTLMYVFDLTNLDVLSEPELILQDNDIVVVEPTNIKIVTLAVSPYVGLLSLFGTVASLALLVIQLTKP